MRIKKNLTKASRSSSTAKSVLLSALILPSAGALNAQPAQLEEVVVTGTRQVIQSTIAIKRDATQVVDGLSAADIGDLPALSIGEALESIAGAASHRENGGATEISIRGLGPFLSKTTVNGREATNGSGDRSVNFSQFPSELMNKIAIYKTQNASQIEGGVAGLIALETLKPLDYNKRRFQIDGKLNYNPDQQDIDNSAEGDFGHRLTLSYVDQFEFANGAALGISIGGQNSEISQPEQEVRSSSPGVNTHACLFDPAITTEGFFVNSAGRDCEDQEGSNTYEVDRDGNPVSSAQANEGYNTQINPETGLAYSDGSPYYFTGSTRSYRQNDTSDHRDSFFVALQFQPNEALDINLDVQVSDRTQEETRYDLLIEAKRVGLNTGASAITVSDTGQLLSYSGSDDLNAQTEQFERTEEYVGGGLAVSYDISDDTTISTDISYSETTRIEFQNTVSVQAGGLQDFSWNLDSGIWQLTTEDFDVTNPDNFAVDSGRIRARLDTDLDRTNTSTAARFDIAHDISDGFFTSFETGFRFSSLEYYALDGGNNHSGGGDGNGPDQAAGRVQLSDASVGDAVAAQCAIDFPESGFLSSLADGNLITNVDANGNVLDSGTGSSFAAFDPACVTALLEEATGEVASFLDLTPNAQTIDVTEDTTAIYVMGNYETSFLDKSLRGNLGLRVINTSVESVGIRDSLTAGNDCDADGVAINDPNIDAIQLCTNTDIQERVTGGSTYTEVLPSFSFVYDYSDEVIIRGGVFRGLSRVNPSSMGFDRTFNTNNQEDDAVDPITTLDGLITDVDATGNPSQEALTSWNFDTSVEWYPNDDSTLSAGIYYKQFKGGFEQSTQTETYNISGESFSRNVLITDVVSDTSNLYGVELTAAYRWDNGIGFKASYNYADTDFEFEDGRYGDLFDADGNQTTIGIVAPASIPGFSEHVFSGQVYYGIGDLDVALIYKYRSEYFQPFTTDPSVIRYVADVGVWEARASYQITDNIRLKVEALNLLDESRSDSFHTTDNFGQASSYGSRVFVGLSAKF